MLVLALLAPGWLPGHDDGQESIRVRVEMVSLPVVVLTRSGRHVQDLRKEEFQVFEDNVQQKIEGFAAGDEPFSVALMLDTSGSTMLKLRRIQDEAIRFIHRLKSTDSVAILSFAEEVNLQLARIQRISWHKIVSLWQGAGQVSKGLTGVLPDICVRRHGYPLLS